MANGFELRVSLDVGGDIVQQFHTQSSAKHQAWQIAERGVGQNLADGGFDIYPAHRIVVISVRPVEIAQEEASSEQV